jgi:hypothetical protein
VLSLNGQHGAPPYFASVGDEDAAGEIWFDYGGEATVIRVRHALPIGAARTAAGQFLREPARSSVPVTYADLVAVWGEGNVVRLPVDGAEYAELPAEARRVLAQVGLPGEVEFFFNQTGPEWVAGAGGVRRYLKIGTDYGYDVGIVADSGEVLTLSSAGHYPSRFVNSGLGYFVEFLCRLVAARRRFRGLDFEEARPLIAKLETELRARDPRAFNDPERWWSVIFEQMKVGLL